MQQPVQEQLRCCMDCGPDVIDDCRVKGCQVHVLIAAEARLKPINHKEFEQKLKKQIKGALKACIHDHGKITRDLIGSVIKRLENQPVYRNLIEEWTSRKNASESPSPSNSLKGR